MCLPDDREPGALAAAVAPGAVAPNANQTAASATGAIAAKTHRHDAASTSQPPSSGPIAVDTADHPAHRPIAVPRSASLNDDSSIARLFGTSMAPAAPCRKRNPSSAADPGASAQPTVAPANATAPALNTRRRP